MVCKASQDFAHTRATTRLTQRHEDWRNPLCELVRRDPLFDTKSSLSALHADDSSWDSPEAVTFGVGLCSAQGRISRGVPLDLVGFVLAAETVRKTLGARSIVALVADAHAISAGVPWSEVSVQTARIEHALDALAERCNIPLVRVRASDLHGTREHVRAQHSVRQVAGTDVNDYVLLQTADTHALGHKYGRVLKLGWSLAGGRDAQRDERFFDRRYRAWMGERASFIYCKASCTLAAERPRAAPYVVFDPERRVLLHPAEDPEHKLQAAARCLSHDRMRAARNHYARIARAYSRMGAPLSGPLEQRLSTLLDELFPRARGAKTFTSSVASLTR